MFLTHLSNNWAVAGEQLPVPGDAFSLKVSIGVW